MFLWDGTGCWGADVDGDGSADLDGDYDLDILVHEFHHGVSLRLNTAFTGNEAGAIGEGGGDFFAYSVNDDPMLAEYALPGGLRSRQRQGLRRLVLPARVVLRGARQRRDLGERRSGTCASVSGRIAVSGSDAAAINESHQLYIDALDALAARADDARHARRDAARRCVAQSGSDPRARTSAGCGNRSPAAAWASARSIPPTAG